MFAVLQVSVEVLLDVVAVLWELVVVLLAGRWGRSLLGHGVGWSLRWCWLLIGRGAAGAARGAAGVGLVLLALAEVLLELVAALLESVVVVLTLLAVSLIGRPLVGRGAAGRSLWLCWSRSLVRRGAAGFGC